jgi:hypothetical protein
MTSIILQSSSVIVVDYDTVNIDRSRNDVSTVKMNARLRSNGLFNLSKCTQVSPNTSVEGGGLIFDRGSPMW